MSKVADPRAIIERKELIAKLDALAGDPETPKSKLRPKVLECLKTALAEGRAEVRRRFEEQKASGAETVAANCFLIDQLIRVIYDFAVERILPQGVRTQGEQISVAAQGGYGRGELSPHSDIDLLFLLPTAKPTPYAEQLVEYILYMLWDLGLTVGHATRSVDECLRQAMNDLTIRTALLEVRWLWGEKALVEQLQLRYRTEIALTTAESFAESKLAERDARHERMGDSRYVLEPNIKEGKGGLRDLQTLLWIAKYLYYVQDIHDLVPRGVLTAQAARKFAQAQNFMWTVRCHLHYLTGREEDRLTFDVQPELAKRMGYAGRSGSRSVERFMKHYFLIAKYVGDLTRIVCAVLEESHKRRPKAGRLLAKLSLKKAIDGFRVEGGRLNVMHDDDFEREPIRILSIFRRAQENGLDIHPKALGQITKHLRLLDPLRNSKDANQIFMDILSSPKGAEDSLRKMNEAGVFGRFIPAFGRVVAQMQFDMYHVYTVDEHTIRAIGILNKIEQGDYKADHPVAHKVIHQLQSRRALYAAALMHDIAKGRGGEHSELGAEIALKLGPRMGLTDEETESVSWLVRHHLFMSQTAFKRDIDDPKTISDFVEIVQSPERLKLLLILTVADIRAVGPTVWNNWKAGLLRELYYRAEEMISGSLSPGEERSTRVEAAKQALAKALDKAGWPKAEIEAHLSRGYPSYWLSSDLEEQIWHANMIRDAEANKSALTVRYHVDTAHAVTAVTIYTDDHPGLFSQIAGAMALSGAGIVDAKIVTLANGMALDTFGVQDADGGPLEDKARMKKLEGNLERALTGRIRLGKELAAKRSQLPTRASAFRVPVRVFLDNMASRTHTLIEVNGRDRPGFLFDVTSAITGQGLQISSAHISTYGERVVDVFYVKDIFGMKVDHEAKLKQLRKALEAAVADPLNPADPANPSPPRSAVKRKAPPASAPPQASA
ncbi:MAG: [protein-PII] uridylyltransferase [Alphaproteobacteria bacterium]|nr:[protein-PII] uridylyltransferase [Alphaproteobacteria bacterium]